MTSSSIAGRIVPGVFERIDEPLYPPDAIREALANAIIYGNAEDASKHVWVRALFGRNTAQVEVTDEGCGFDYRCLPDPTVPFARMQPRGRGLFLIRELVDEVRFNALGNSICLILRRD